MMDHGSHRSGFVKRVIELLRTRLDDENFGVSELAGVLGISRSQLHRKMRRGTGKTSSQFIREYRLKRAFKLLRQGDLSVSEVAYRVGFRNTTYFHSSFRQQYGVTPGEVRRRGDIAYEAASLNRDRSYHRRYPRTNSVLVYIGGGLALTCFFLIALVQPIWPVDLDAGTAGQGIDMSRDSSATMHFLQGEHLRQRNQPDAHREAIAHYQEAIARDSTYLQAYLGLADTYMQCGSFWGEWEAKEAWGLARDVLQLGLRSLPGEPLIEEKLLAGYFNFERDLEKAESLYRKHTGGEKPVLPNSPLALEYALKTGRHYEALSSIDLQLIHNPASPGLYLLKVKALLLSGKITEARLILYAYRSLFSDNYYFLIESCRLFILLEDYKQAEYFLRLFEKRFRERPPVVLWARAEIHRQLGMPDVAMNYIRELEWRHKAATAGSPAWFLALFYARQNKPATALEWLRHSFAHGETELTWLMQEPWLQPLRNENAYQELYRAIGYQELSK